MHHLVNKMINGTNSSCCLLRLNGSGFLRFVQIVGILLICWMFSMMYTNPSDCSEQEKALSLLPSGNVFYKQDNILTEVLKAQTNTTIYDDIKVIEGAVYISTLERPYPEVQKPACKGDLQGQEVEDLLCMPRPKFIEGVKNPCWWHPPGDEPSKKSEIRCLPYFHILGCEKCGTSDLWDRITMHPDTVRIQGTVNKEANWWGWQRYGYFVYRVAPVRNMSYYSSYFFKPLNNLVRTSLLSGGDAHKRLVTGDGTPSDMMDFRGWRFIPQNRGLAVPQVLTPHLMKHLYPKPRLIVILRNPIDRLYSEFYFTNHGRDAGTFHAAVEKSIRLLANCLRFRRLEQCFHDDGMMHALPVRLHFLFYNIYIREWLRVFDRKEILFFKFEEYMKDTASIVKRAFQFLDLPPLKQSQLDKIVAQKKSRVGVAKKRAGKMRPETRKLLEALVKQSNRNLPELISDAKFNWP